MKRQRPSSANSPGPPSEEADDDPNKRSKQSTDEWAEGYHRDFVSAIFEVGLKHSSPSAILEYMARNDNLTVERVKSRLQKFRLKRDESKEAFMNSYDENVARFKAEADEAAAVAAAGGEGAVAPTYGEVRNRAGEPAAFLTHAVVAEVAGRTIPTTSGSAAAATRAAAASGASAAAGSSNRSPHPLYASNPATRQYGPVADSSLPAIAALAEAASRGVFGTASTSAAATAALVQPIATTSTASSDEIGGALLRLPHLSEAERNTPLGKSMVHMVGLFVALKGVLLKQRAEASAPGEVGNGGVQVEQMETSAAAAVHSQDQQEGAVR
mmetsp:Transcript_32587/g.71504  ORF Transcript_32587/g.71504 Transcript_32587/m.71504 type:complete len:327 (-) Transcript_32587:1142-2122(-)|eukprot:CAMPEP_0178503788 /NCGR_PEP_ID=MMETSP0696-20121128/18231_1 /TAXON_ID=265572 /ORGANISM="Extubocellulus spinifer, Strain CCMP396" /LENGTH=326 /DNA_ID=CAMNT_0020132949 /DNA_START=105 /DNA_END=1085 /DNA_ORIENTATION=+